MDTPTLRILDTISSNIGDSLSINQLTKRIKDTYGSAYYANIYQKLQELKTEGLLNLEPTGRYSNIKLNFQNYLLTDTLAEMEIEKKISFLSTRSNLFPLLTEMDKSLSDKCTINSITAINPLRNIKLNRLELLFLLRETPDYLNETIDLFKGMLELQKKHNTKINNLIIDKNDLFDLATSDEINPVREALREKITFFGPQAFWQEINEIAEKTQVKTLSPETKPLDISDLDLTFNLNRFGYREFGSQFAEGKKICIEYIITAILLKDEPRKTEATAIILSKNNFKSNVLAFLSQKYQTTGRLMGILKTLERIKIKPKIEKTIEILRTLNEQEVPADEASVKQKLELYNAL
jgi:hypothetical protein